MYKQAQFGLLLILISIDLILSLTAPNNVCKTFEGYYTNKDCYYNADQISEVVIITLILSIFWGKWYSNTLTILFINITKF